MDQQKIEQVLNETLPGLTLFYRDTTIDPRHIEGYHQGQIITERGFTDVSFKGGAPTGNLRYLIASAFGRNLSAFNPESEKTGHILLQRDAWFKILDVYKSENVTQVFLLHILPQHIETWRIIKTSVEEDLVKKSRENFGQKIKSVKLPEHLQSDWLERTKFPLGMSDNGEFFYKTEQKTDPIKTGGSVAKEEKNDKAPWWKFW
jgi:hypothetical protein